MSKWPKVKLGEVLIEQKQRIGTFDADNLPLLGVSNSEGLHRSGMPRIPDMSRYLRVEQDWFAYNPMRINVGSIGWAEKSEQTGVISPDYVVFSCSERILPRLLFSFLKHRRGLQAINNATAGSVRERLYFDKLAQIDFPLPPLAEQRRVVARIEELAGQIHEARTLRHQAAEEAEALYPQQLGEAMTPQGEGWKRETVEDVIKSMDAGWSPQCDDIPAQGDGWGVLKTTAVQWCDFQPQHNKALPPTLAPIPTLSVKEGDVLVTRAGPRKRVAVVAAVRRDEPRLTISDKLIRLRTDRAKIEPRFLELSLASPFSQEYLVQRKTGLADAQVNISQAILKATPVAYPPLTEQRRIVAELDALQAEVDALKRLQAETAAELDALLPAILDKAFKGEL